MLGLHHVDAPMSCTRGEALGPSRARAAPWDTLMGGGCSHHVTPQHHTTRDHATPAHPTPPHTPHPTPPHPTPPHPTPQHNTTQHNTTQRNATQRNATQRNATQRNATQHNTTQHNTTQHNTTTGTQQRTTRHRTAPRHGTRQHKRMREVSFDFSLPKFLSSPNIAQQRGDGILNVSATRVLVVQIGPNGMHPNNQTQSQTVHIHYWVDILHSGWLRGLRLHSRTALHTTQHRGMACAP